MRRSKLDKVGYELSSINIVQAQESLINHRNEDCNPFVNICGRSVYPVIVAPMGAVTNDENYIDWIRNNFICVVPRTVSLTYRDSASYFTFASYSLDEAFNHLSKWDPSQNSFSNVDIQRYVCIDIAHGTMKRLYDICRILKKKYGNKMIIMTGNVANPDAYLNYADIGIDYMRASIGSGSRCTTACNVGVHYPMATLIDELNSKRLEWEKVHGTKAPTKIIADGGLTNFDDIQKCLALGAYAVMNGSWFAKSEEACEPVYYYTWFGKFKDTNNIVLKTIYKLIGGKRKREYYGMSTRRAQFETGRGMKKTAEGINKLVCVEYPIAKWADNMKNYLCSAMSYTDSKTIDELRENTELIINLSGDASYRK